MNIVESSTIGQGGTALSDRLDAAELTEAIAAVLRESLRAYRAIPLERFVERVVPVIRDNVDLILRVLREGQPVELGELDQFRRTAAERAAEGMALGDVLGAYRLGARLIYGRLVDTHQPGEEPALLRATDLLMQYIDQVSGAAAQAYVEEFRHVVKEDERDLRALFDAVAGPGPVAPDLRDKAERFGLGSDTPVHPVVVIAGRDDARAGSTLAASLREQGILAISEAGTVLALSAALPAALLPDEPDLLAAYGRPTDAPELSEAVDTLRNAAALGFRLGRRGCIPVSELFLERLLASAPEFAAGFAADVLAPIRPSGRRNAADLIATMRTYLELDLSRRAAASALHIHVNTLDNRLSRIRELTAIDLTTTVGVVRASLALSADALPAP